MSTAPPEPRATRNRPSPAGRRLEGRALPPLTFPEELPVSAMRDEIGAAIAAHQVVIVCGETGSGKTTQLPKICLSLGRGIGAGGTGLIGHTQPRRLAATSTARRLAAEIGSPLGEHVGFKIRFNDRFTPGASVKLMTDGILLAETQGDPLLRAYDTLIIDEAHERSLNIDFLLGYLRQILPRRPDLKLVITSATIDVERFANHFARGGVPAPVIQVSGRLYPVEVRYRPIEAEAGARDQLDALVDAVDEACSIGSGDVLVFLPGERQIRDAAAALRQRHPPGVEILTLFARLSATEQERVFQSHGARRIVLATNVAETSLTVPGIHYVVDTGEARVKRYSYRNKVEQLHIEPISQAAARQRAGRCGRVAAGVCIRLYAEQEFAARAEFTDPEILRSSLAAVILRMKALGLGEIESFPFVERPPARAIADGYQLLGDLGALGADNELTSVGRELARLPLDPRVGRLILAGRDHDCLTEMLILGSALSLDDVRERPFEQQEAADQAHKRFAHERSEFLSDLALWKWFDEALAHKKSQRQLRELCRQQFLSQSRLRDWREVHAQLHTIVAEHGWRLNGAPATYEQVHLALLTGLIGNVGVKADEEAYYLGARSTKFYLWPGSTLARKGARWLVAAELVETTRLFARTLARIEPEWLEKVGGHLLKRSWGDPHWEKRAGRVVALERATLYGLVVYAGRRVDFASHDLARARAIFIRDGLVPAMTARDELSSIDQVVLAMLAHNRRLIVSIEQLEHKARRPDVLVADSLIEALCESVIPAEVCSVHDFEIWYRRALRETPRLLYLERDDLMRHEAAGVTTELFPKALEVGGVVMQLAYHFEPGSSRDGVTLTVPLYALNLLDAAELDWLVPGMRREKAQLLLKSLPQKLRRHCVPLPEYAQAFIERIGAESRPQHSMIAALIADVRHERGVPVSAGDFRIESLPAHLVMNFKVVDEHGRQLAMGRNLASLRSELGVAAQNQFREAFVALREAGAEADQAASATRASSARGSSGALATPVGGPAVDGDWLHTQWDFGELPELLEVRRGNRALVGYPALVDSGEGVRIQVFDDPREAARVHRLGLLRLFALQLRDALRHLEKNVPGLQQMALHYLSLGTQEVLRDQIIGTALERSFLQEPLPADAAQFAARLTEGRSRLNLLAQEIARLAGQVLLEYAALPRKLASVKAHAAACADMQSQLTSLVPKDFVAALPYSQLAHLPRYLKAISARIDKLRSDPARDARLMAEMAPLLQRYRRTLEQRRGEPDERLAEFGWLLEELRVALFAQELRTPMSVSVKRLQKVWDSLSR
jgi:ATP-dependent helicase HrpA